MVKRMGNDIDQRLPRREEGGRIIIGEGIRFERIRRITGYRVGSVERFNNAKRAEVTDRVKHAVMR